MSKIYEIWYTDYTGMNNYITYSRVYTFSSKEMAEKMLEELDSPYYYLKEVELDD